MDKSWIEKNVLSKNNGLLKRWRPFSFQELKKIPEFKEILKFENYSVIQNIYMFYHDILEAPTCPICGKELRFLNWNLGFTRFCSSKCANRAPKTKEKIKKTCLEKYGTSSFLATENCKTKREEKFNENSKQIVEKIKETKLKKYGDEFFNNHEKTKQTLLANYGVLNSFQLEETKEKIKKTCLEKYGVDWTSKVEFIRKKQIISNKYKNFENFVNVLRQNRNLDLLTKKEDLYDVDELEFKCLLCR